MISIEDESQDLRYILLVSKMINFLGKGWKKGEKGMDLFVPPS